MLAQSVNHVALDKFYPPTISENPAFVFSYCINLGGISQERDFEKSESLLLCKGNRTRRDLNRPGVKTESRRIRRDARPTIYAKSRPFYTADGFLHIQRFGA